VAVSGLSNSLIEALPFAVVLIDANARINGLNGAARLLLGGSLEGRHYLAVLRQPELSGCIERALVERQTGTAQFLRGGTGEYDITYRVQAAPVQLETGPGVLVSFEDTTDLQRAGQMRRDFVANVSHELKTPLTGLLGFIETLKGAARDDPAARVRFLDIMEREANRMNRLVSDLLSLSRVESNERVRPASLVDLATVLVAAVTALRPVAQMRGVEMTLEQGEAVALHGDEDQLMQVFTNLIENAIKYGGAGGSVRILVARHPPGAGFRSDYVQVDVADRGEGFDPVHIPRLTERFYRVDTHRSHELGGTGLGLAIVKHIIGRHRGRLRIAAAVGKGATFSVQIPVPDRLS
jgi:two-component system phosphate regulon sensor histidine kinase PhoR